MSSKKPSAALTGDLIDSRKAGARRVDEALDTLRTAAERFGKFRNFDPKFTRFRGDGWQVHIPWPQYVLEAMLCMSGHLRAAGLGLETRISAGIGTIDSPGTTDLSDASGNAFTTSGENLERMRKPRKFAIAGDGIEIWQKAIVDLIDHQSSGWTAAQAEVVAMWVEETTIQEEIAQRLGITRQAVQARMSSAGFSALERSLDAFLDHDFQRTPEKSSE